MSDEERRKILQADRVRKYDALHRELRAKAALSSYYKNREKRIAYSKAYKLLHPEKVRAKQKHYSETHREQLNEKARLWRAKNIDHCHDLQNKCTWRKKGLDAELGLSMYRASHNCDICGVEIEGRNKHLDHDHKTLRIRGVLCNECNTGIGKLKENPELFQRALEYLGRE